MLSLLSKKYNKYIHSSSGVFYFSIFLLIALCISLIYRSAYTIGNNLYFSLVDDQMISMRYAKNLANGFGLVWNPHGAKIEGYTNLVWTLYMSLFHLLRIPLPQLSLCLQISGVVFLILNLLVMRRLIKLIFGNNHFIINLSIFLTALYLPLIKWSIYGTEVSILTLLTTTSVYLTNAAIIKKRVNYLIFLLLGLGVLIRIDYIVISVVIIVYLFFYFSKKSNFYANLFIFCAICLIQLIFTFLYYGNIFPNTYYLKMSGYPLLLRLTKGLYATFIFIQDLNWVLFIGAFNHTQT